MNVVKAVHIRDSQGREVVFGPNEVRALYYLLGERLAIRPPVEPEKPLEGNPGDGNDFFEERSGRRGRYHIARRGAD